jgi:hypothetical protein
MADGEKKDGNPIEEAKQTVATFETAGCACVNLGCLLIILAVGSIIAVLLDVTSIEGISRIAGYVWKATSDAIVSIFK